MSRNLLPQDYTVGSGDAEDRCDLPGYYQADKSTNGCWTGNKPICKFDPELYRKTGTYKDMSIKYGAAFADNNMPSQFFVFGNAPFCGDTTCDAVAAGKLPIGFASYGKGIYYLILGEYCATGYKVVAIEPVTAEQIKKVEDMKANCDAQAAKGAEIAGQVMGTIGSIAGIVGKFI